VKGYLCLFLLLGVATSCTQPFQVENGICKTSDGEINTYNPIGVWKKISTTDTTDVFYTSGSNYRLLYLVSGGVSEVTSPGKVENIPVYYSNLLCEEVHSGKNNVDTAKIGAYFFDDGNSRLRTAIFNNEKGETAPTENWVTYRFSGSCGNTMMTLRYRSTITGKVNKTEKYQYYNGSTGEDPCSN
jgi:hypothetical protein